MVRTTKIACDEVIYTVRKDAYDSTVETDVPDAENDELTLDSDAAMQAERARYADVLRELSEYEQTVASAEDKVARDELLDQKDNDDIVDSLY